MHHLLLWSPLVQASHCVDVATCCFISLCHHMFYHRWCPYLQASPASRSTYRCTVRPGALGYPTPPPTPSARLCPCSGSLPFWLVSALVPSWATPLQSMPLRLSGIADSHHSIINHSIIRILSGIGWVHAATVLSFLSPSPLFLRSFLNVAPAFPPFLPHSSPSLPQSFPSIPHPAPVFPSLSPVFAFQADLS